MILDLKDGKFELDNFKPFKEVADDDIIAVKMKDEYKTRPDLLLLKELSRKTGLRELIQVNEKDIFSIEPGEEVKFPV